VEPGPVPIHHHGGSAIDQLRDGHAVAHQLAGGASGGAHGPRAGPGMARSATTGPGARSSPASSATRSRCCSRDERGSMTRGPDLQAGLRTLLMVWSPSMSGRTEHHGHPQ
jgi:hypothetical protein